jgi:formylglycine-generating enzyme required for sulfatase activity
MAATVQCRGCQNYIEADGEFCEYCGTRIVAQQNEIPASPAQAWTQTINRSRLTVAVLVMVLLGSLAVLLGRRANTEPVTVTAVTSVETRAATEEPKPSPPPPDGMVYVPGGTFQMGRKGGDEFEQPAHEVTVAPFYMDQREVTCAAYAKFLQETNSRPAPPGWSNNKPPAGNELLPMTGVSWSDANAYAQWAGKRLPTEEEWEFAARGNTGSIYPWGNEWKPNCANAATTAAGKMVQVGSYTDGKSPFGVLDMVGNAWEWTASKLKPYPGGKLPPLPDQDLRVIRGNFWRANQNQATTTYRRGYPAVNEDYTNTGFRCVKDVTR